MNKLETIAYLKGKKEGLRLLREELKIFRRRIEVDIRFAKDELKEWEKMI